MGHLWGAFAAVFIGQRTAEGGEGKAEGGDTASQGGGSEEEGGGEGAEGEGAEGEAGEGREGEGGEAAAQGGAAQGAAGGSGVSAGPEAPRSGLTPSVSPAGAGLQRGSWLLASVLPVGLQALSGSGSWAAGGFGCRHSGPIRISSSVF